MSENDSATQEKPYGYAFQHEDTGLQQIVDVQQVEWGFEKNNPRWIMLGPVYLYPLREQGIVSNDPQQSPRMITDKMVEDALRTFYDGEWMDGNCDHWAARKRIMMHAAIDAALSASYAELSCTAQTSTLGDAE